MLKYFVLLNFVSFCTAKWSEDLQVGVENGKILGRYMTSESGREFRAFMGIPYAEPPVGDLRFRSPVKKRTWSVVLKTQNEPPKCTSYLPYYESFEPIETVGQEDCLYLNVYAPKTVQEDTNLSVMVYIHGGSWIYGSGGYSEYSPEYFLNHDVILVTGNYRLGVLGFLSFGDASCPGNFGLKDQSMILQWVKTNIDKFGGDSNKVTIFGHSAGSASVHYHMISPMSKGLFHQAIMQSGSLFNTWSNPSLSRKSRKLAMFLARKMRCSANGTSFDETVTCLRAVNASDLALVGCLAKYFVGDDGKTYLTHFSPVIENFYQDEECFICSRVYQDNSFDIPLMIGLTSDEGLLESARFLILDDLELDLKIFFYNYTIKLIFRNFSPSKKELITRRINNFYFDNGVYDGIQDKSVTDLISDIYMSVGIFETLKIRLQENNIKHSNNTFVYMFSHKGFTSFYKVYSYGDTAFHGTAHSDDLLYLFSAHRFYSKMNNSIQSKDDRELSNSMVKMWVNFATTGQPTPKNGEIDKIPFWSSSNSFPLDYMLIGNSNGNRNELFTMEKGLLETRRKFWGDLVAEFQVFKEIWLNKTESQLNEIENKGAI